MDRLPSALIDDDVATVMGATWFVMDFACYSLKKVCSH